MSSTVVYNVGAQSKPSIVSLIHLSLRGKFSDAVVDQSHAIG